MFQNDRQGLAVLDTVSILHGGLWKKPPDCAVLTPAHRLWLHGTSLKLYVRISRKGRGTKFLVSGTKFHKISAK